MGVRDGDHNACDGTLCYRLDDVGERVAVLPATCRGGGHGLATVGFRAVLSEGTVVVQCAACTVSGVDRPWRLTAVGPSPVRAELDTEPYRNLGPCLTPHR